MSFLISLLTSILKTILPTIIRKANEPNKAKDAPKAPKSIRSAWAKRVRGLKGHIRSRVERESTPTCGMVRWLFKC